MSVKLDDTVYLHFGTASASTGAATDADSTPTATVEEDGVAMGYGPTVTNVATGLYRVTIACTTGNGFETGKRYSVYVVATVGTITGRDGIGEFLVESAVVDDVYSRIGAPAGANIAADLVVIDNFVDDLETRLSAARAGYLDNLSAGAVAQASVCTEARLGELDAANIPTDLSGISSAISTVNGLVDDLETRLTAIRAGYLDNLSAGAVAQASVCTEARLGELDAANIPTDLSGISSNVTTINGLVDDLESRLTATRAGYLDNLAGGAVALASELSKTLGATAGKKVISADGLQVEVYDESDTLLVTLDRTGAGPYTWTPTWE